MWYIISIMEPLAKLTNRKSRYNWEAAWHLFIAGATLEETAALLDIPYSTVVQHSAKCHWSARRTQALEVAREAIKGDLKGRIERARTKHQNKMLEQLDHTMGHIENMEIGEDSEAGEVPVERKLAALDKQDVIARRVLGMDKEDGSDPMKAGFLLLAALGQANHLVNESYEEAQIVEEPQKSLPNSINLNQSEGGEETQNNPSPLSTPSNDTGDPLPGILRSGNAISKEADSEIFHPFAPKEPQIGQTGPELQPKPLPEHINFEPPKPLVNETEDKTKDESHE